MFLSVVDSTVARKNVPGSDYLAGIVDYSDKDEIWSVTRPKK